MTAENIDDWFNNLRTTYEKGEGAFAGHKTGNSIKLFPFSTKFNEKQCDQDLSSFNGIIGESFRLKLKRQYPNNFKSDKEKPFIHKLRDSILEEAISRTETNGLNEHLKDVLIEMFFEEDGGIVKYDKSVLTYMNFATENAQLRDIAKYVFDIFIDNNHVQIDDFRNSTDGNIFFKLLSESLPKLIDSDKSNHSKKFPILHQRIVELFLDDYKNIERNRNDYLKHLQDLVKYYYFFYLSQTAIQLNQFSTENKTEPIYFSLDWETLSESRLAYKFGWKRLENNLTSLFAHAFTVELLNYLPICDNLPTDYATLLSNYNTLSENEKENVCTQIERISDFYMIKINDLKDAFRNGSSWEKCELALAEQLSTKKFSSIESQMFSLYYRVNYQFLNSGRNPRYNDYAKWFIQFSKLNYTKRRGRLGFTTALNQETLLLLTKLCVGDNEKIRVKEFWDELEKRGIKFDESSKLEVIKLFERINLLEKKSDSGDAQYVKSII